MTGSSPAWTDPRACTGALPQRPHLGGILAYAGFMLTALAAGLWPGAIYQPHTPSSSPVLPVLAALAAGQTAFMLLGYPLVLWARRRRWGGAFSPRLVGRESVAILLAGLPLMLVGAYLSDGGAADVLRVELALAALMPLAWAVGAGPWKSAVRSAATLAMLLVTLGLPAMWYVMTEFAPAAETGWLWSAGPLTYAWSNGAESGGSWWPQPLWAWLAQLGVGVTGVGLIAIVRLSPRGSLPPGTTVQ